MKQYKRVVSIGGHPLDAELMGGPLCIRLSSLGAKCTMMHVTTGRLERKDASVEDNNQYLKELNDQIKKTAEGLDCGVYQMNYLSSNMPEMKDFVQVLCDYFKKEQVDLVITHHNGTMHDRHYYTHRGVKEAVKRLRSDGIEIELLYGENLEDLVGFTPTMYLQITEEETKKWFAALKNYEIFNGGVNTVPYLQYYTTMGKVRAIEAGCPGFVKAFMHAGLIEYAK